jgi:glycosyltransferase involved in cell wall biosynthesis
MRILLVSLWHVEYAIELAEALGKYHYVHLVLFKERVKHTVGQSALSDLGPNLRCSLLPFQSLRHPSTISTAIKIFGIVCRFNPDVIHIQECYNPLNTLFFFLRGYPIIATVHDAAVHPGKEARSIPKWKLSLNNMIRKYAYHKIIVHGHAVKKQYLQIYKEAEQDIFVIPHGCLFSFKTYEENQSIEEPNTVLFFGRIQQYKGLRYLIEAEPLVSEVIPDFKIIIAGEGDDLAKHKSRILNNPHYEIHDGFIPNKSVAKFFNRASIIVLPYIEASQSGIVAMAFAFGKPVIVTNVGSLSEMVIDDYSGIVVPPQNATELGQAIIRLLKDSSKRERLARNTKRIARTELGWNNIAKLTVEVYRKAVVCMETKLPKQRLGPIL